MNIYTYLSDGFRIELRADIDWSDRNNRINTLRQFLEAGWLWVATSSLPPPKHWSPIGQCLAWNMLDAAEGVDKAFEETLSSLHPALVTEGQVPFVGGEAPKPDWDHPDEAPMPRSPEFWKLQRVKALARRYQREGNDAYSKGVGDMFWEATTKE